VLRLVIEGNRARGVAVQRDDGSLETISAGEVIVCAGAFDSPRILLLSGIGPVAQLERLGIAPVADLPVGENLIDHLLIGVVYDSLQPISDCNAYATEGCAFARSTPGRLDCDIQISFAKEPHFAPERNDGMPRFTIIPGITRPRSRGTVCLTDADPDAPLEIDPCYFSHPDDMRAMIRAVQLSREIAQQAALATWNAGEHFPGAAVCDDNEIAAYVARDVSTWFHPVGTCRMGIGADAVVDPTLRVRGIAGLRIADASIMPDIVSVNTNAAATMIGWKAGDHALA
jgi:choline dehydrogenase